MKRTPVALILSGASGHGKSVAAVSFRTPELPQPRRLALGFELGLSHYRSSDNIDHPEQLLYAFDHFPLSQEESIPECDDVIKLCQMVQDSDYDVLVIDNVVLLQELICLTADQGDGAMALMKAFALEPAYRMVASTFGKGMRDQTYWRLVKDVLRKMILGIRKSKHLIATTEEKNVWQNYGSRDRNSPPRIIGKTAKLLLPWLQFTDGILSLSRTLPSGADGKPKLTDVPMAQVDAFNPKNRVVGLPSRFAMQWDFLWDCVDRRQIPTKEAMAEVVTEAPQVVEEEASVSTPAAEDSATAAPVCTKCGNAIAAGVDAKGKPFTSEKLIELTTRTLAQPMCYECYRKGKEENVSRAPATFANGTGS
jgi:hypothetical protein